MTLTFENDNDVIVYALEKIIDHARRNQYIFVAQSIWWIASLIGVTDSIVIHINNKRLQFEGNQASSEVRQWSSEIASVPQDHLRIDTEGISFHPDRIPQIDNIVGDNLEVENSEPELGRSTLMLQSANRFIGKSRKERRPLEQKPCALSHARSGKVPVKPLTKKQRNRLQAISKDTLSGCITESKKWHKI